VTNPRTIMNPSARGGDDAALLIDLDSTDGNTRLMATRFASSAPSGRQCSTRAIARVRLPT